MTIDGNKGPKAEIRRKLWAALSALILALLIVPVHRAALAQGTTHGTGAFPVRIVQARADNEHGVTSSDCVVVMPDGRLHLERRRQVLPSPTAALSIFESLLDSSQLEHLRDIVKNLESSGTPEYDSRRVYFQNALWFSSVTVNIGEGGGARRFGYWAWDPQNAGPDVPNDVRRDWSESETALRPLVDWLHGIDALKLPPSDAKPTQCLADQSE